ncbi:acetyl-CoA synthetase [Streptomyces sp. 3213]|uniref:IclR family transcriptional regulator n=1 Tax=Streptomyces sp. 3213.3 TaxID=1855348 RepID=UPI000896ACDF|nr:IclR family transcriptional regulator [Streptomyces sp. 3213.3]SEF04642.1 acetyl-CoA synthetase [Streptomyces sp. 3213] [Streptomyces sp. 3213.3]
MTGSDPQKRTAATTLQTVERALAFLELVAVSGGELTVRDVAGRLGVNLTTCYHLYNTLAAHGYVERNPDLTLRVGRQTAVLYDGYRRAFSGQRRMQEFVAELAAETTETAWLSNLTGDEVVLTAYTEGPQAVRATGLYVGLAGLEHVRSSGKAVLAHLDDERRDRILQKSLSGIAPAQHPAILDALERDLALTRKRGWALDDETYIAGIVGIAAPFFSTDGAVLGAVGVWSPAARAHQSLDALAEQVAAAAGRASALFGGMD